MKYTKEFLQKKGIPHLPEDWDSYSEGDRVKFISMNYPAIFEKIFKPENLINWSELSRYLNQGDRNRIRRNKIPDDYQEEVRALVKVIKKWQQNNK